MGSPSQLTSATRLRSTRWPPRSPSRLGPIDICFSNAGVATGGDILTTEPDVWNEQWAINVMAHVYAVRAVLPAMLARGGGYLVHTASMAGILTSHGNVTYATTKHAVVGLAEWLSITYHHRGIRVSLLAPLGVRTPMLERADPRFAASVAGPIKEPEDVAAAVVDAVRRGAVPRALRSDRADVDAAQDGRLGALAARACAECSNSSRTRRSPQASSTALQQRARAPPRSPPCTSVPGCPGARPQSPGRAPRAPAQATA